MAYRLIHTSRRRWIGGILLALGLWNATSRITGRPALDPFPRSAQTWSTGWSSTIMIASGLLYLGRRRRTIVDRDQRSIEARWEWLGLGWSRRIDIGAWRRVEVRGEEQRGTGTDRYT